MKFVTAFIKLILKTNSGILIGLAIFFSQSLWATVNLRQDTGQGKVEFHALGRPSMLHVTGTGEAPKGHLKIDDRKITGEFVFVLDSFQTGIDLRDHHMKEKYLETGKFPSASLKITEVSLPEKWSPTALEAKEARFRGLLNLHGVEKPVEGTFSVEKSNELIKVNAKMNIKLSEFAIQVPNYLGITITDEVPVDISMDHLEISETKSQSKKE